MAIRPVSSVSFRNNNISFESKKKKHPETHRHSTNAIKAVPIAALLALSPMIESYAQVAPSEHTEFVQGDCKILQDEYKNVSSILGAKSMMDNCSVITTIKPDGTSFKQLYYSTTDKSKVRIDKDGPFVPVVVEREYVLNPKSLTIVKETRKSHNGECNYYTRYYVVGPGAYGTTYYKLINKENGLYDKGEVVNTQMSETKMRKLEISKAFYNQLKEIYGESIDYNQENIETEDNNSYLDLLY